jgi:hypothetical protein
VKVNIPNTAATTVSKSAAGTFPTVNLQYVQPSAIRVRGPVTGRLYDFSGAQPFTVVDVRDAVVLTGTTSFRRSSM